MARVYGRVAIVTGGALGMGLAHAKALAKEGAKIAIADVNGDAGAAAVEELKAGGAEAIFVQLDVTSEESWASAARAVADAFGRIDILVNNAGIYLSGTVESTPLDVWERTMAVNARGVFLGSKTVIPFMRKAGGGSIINICSNWGIVAFPDAAAYVASKGAVRLLTKATASEVAKDNIRVNSVHPSFTITNMTKDLVNDPEKVKLLVGPSLLGRPARAEEIASTVLFLASDESSFMTGSELVVDGGYPFDVLSSRSTASVADNSCVRRPAVSPTFAERSLIGFASSLTKGRPRSSLKAIRRTSWPMSANRKSASAPMSSRSRRASVGKRGLPPDPAGREGYKLRCREC